ncbi:DUF3300 domain-containing protein [Segnochrobactraceae bacterium EtOH-i3]
MASLWAGLVLSPPLSRAARAQTAPPPAAAAASAADVQDQAPAPLTDAELRILVARIALYPDELVALISAAALYPLQIVEAERFLEARAKDPKRAPKPGWDPSIVALLNYPDIVGMMSDDLDWTQQLGEALTYQQKDVLVAIQQLRAEAVANGVIASNDQVQVTTSNDTVVIQSTNPEKVYVPQYAPEMFYTPGYAMAPVTYSDPYTSYFWPTATFFTAAVTGAVWAAAVDWNDWGVWGGRWNGNVDVDCNNCFNNRNFNGRLNMADIDWKNVDRNKLSFDRNQLSNFDRNAIGKGIVHDRGDRIGNLANRPEGLRPGHGAGPGPVRDVRRSTLEGLKSGPHPDLKDAPKLSGLKDSPHPKAAAALKDRAPGGVSRPDGVHKPAGVNRPANVKRPAGARPGGKIDHRPSRPSGLGEVRSGKAAQIHSGRGGKAMGGGMAGHPPRGGGKAIGGGHGGGPKMQRHPGGGGRAGGHGGGRRH